MKKMSYNQPPTNKQPKKIKMNKITNRITDAWRQITRTSKSSLLLSAIVALGFFAMPTMTQAQIGGGGTGAGTDANAETGAEGDAANRTSQLFRTFRVLAGWVLLVALVLAGLMAAFGQYKTAWGVAIAAIVIYGGTWVIGMIRESLNSGTTGS
jgi:membrane protein YdbS with pleckstrin-like domain